MEPYKIFISAGAILHALDSVQLAMVTPEGYPRACEMELVDAEGLEKLWFTSRCDSYKVACFRQNSKAGVSYSLQPNSVSLTGHVEILEDGKTKRRIWTGKNERYLVRNEDGSPKYCILCFTTTEARFLIEGEKLCHRFREENTDGTHQQ